MRRILFATFLLIYFIPYSQGKIVATVDGIQISEEQLINNLMKLAGEPILKEMIDNILVEKEAEKEKITVTPEEVQMRIDIFRRLNTPPGVDLQQDLINNGTTLARLTFAFRLGLLLDKLVAKRENITVSDIEVENEFKKISKERFVRYILVKSEEDALSLGQKLREGSFSFQELAEKYSQEPTSREKGGELGWVRRGTLPAYFEDVIFNLKIGQVSDPIWTRYGFYFLKVEKERDTEFTPQIREEIRQTILSAKVGLRRFLLLDELRSKAKIEILSFVE